MTRPGTRIEPPVPGAVHVWHADLDLPDARLRALAATLALDERDRAARLQLGPPRRRFVAGRGLLRAILGAYLGSDPGEVPLTYGAAGKPHLAGTPAALAFNLAHSEELAVCAVVAAGREVGVDVERLRLIPDMLAIAACCFSARERAFLARLYGTERVGAFFRAWTRKEAWLKAVGGGLPLGPERVEVTMAAGEPARLLAVAGLPDAPLRWSLQDLLLRPGYAAALAVSGPVRHCLCRAWAWEGSSGPHHATASAARGLRRLSEHIPPGGSGGAGGGGVRWEGSSKACGTAGTPRPSWPR